MIHSICITRVPQSHILTCFPCSVNFSLIFLSILHYQSFFKSGRQTLKCYLAIRNQVNNSPLTLLILLIASEKNDSLEEYATQGRSIHVDHTAGTLEMDYQKKR